MTFVEKMYWVGNEHKGGGGAGRDGQMDSLRVTKTEEKFLFKMDRTKAVHHTKITIPFDCDNFYYLINQSRMLTFLLRYPKSTLKVGYSYFILKPILQQ